MLRSCQMVGDRRNPARVFALGAAILAFCTASGAVAAMTPAGTIISNVAQLAYRYAGSPANANSNRVDITVGEIIDFKVTPAPICRAAAASNLAIVAFRITNLGNGSEAFIPDAPIVRNGNFVARAVVEDSNDNGCYNPGIDQPIPSGGRTRAIRSGGSTTIFVIGTGTTGDVTLPVSSATGTSEGGTSRIGGGDGGGDAVFSPTGGGVNAVSVPLSGPLQPSLVKSQAVLAPDGSANPSQGAIITYTIDGSFSGSGTASGVVIADAIPTGTTYLPGSLKLDGQTISDSGDSDAGRFDGTQVSVALGDVVAASTHRVSFQVKIK